MAKRRSERDRTKVDYSKLSGGFSDDDDDFVDTPPRPQKKNKANDTKADCRISEKPKPITCEKYIYSVKETNAPLVSHFSLKEIGTENKKPKQALSPAKEKTITQTRSPVSSHNVRRDLAQKNTKLVSVSLVDVLSPINVANDNLLKVKGESCIGAAGDSKIDNSELTDNKSDSIAIESAEQPIEISSTESTPTKCNYRPVTTKEKSPGSIKPEVITKVTDLTSQMAVGIVETVQLKRDTRSSIEGKATSKREEKLRTLHLPDATKLDAPKTADDSTVRPERPSRKRTSKSVPETLDSPPVKGEPLKLASKPNVCRQSARNVSIGSPIAETACSSKEAIGHVTTPSTRESSTARNGVSDRMTTPISGGSSSVDARTKVAASKWRAPGRADCVGSKTEQNSSASVSPVGSGLGLRLGLSRNIKIKSLHSNVKFVNTNI